ncbi:MAG: glycoside hydrolase family 127 protein [Sedimentisphaerales bacterium]|nr:glycoside hydrolase family 127 protein [Sedimentisphaerales bacterium]
MVRYSIVFICILAGVFSVICHGDTVRIVDRPQDSTGNDYYIGNREPLLPSPLILLEPGAVKPDGWLEIQLRLQADGFHGHLTEISKFLEKKDNAWLFPDTGQHGWEEPVYWLKGFLNCGYVLGDERIIAESKIWIEGILNSQKPDGWFGPDQGRKGIATGLQGREDLWPNMIALFCLQDYYEFTHDQRVILLMTNYMKYLMTVPDDKFLVGYWPKMRGGDLLYSVYWLYNRTGDKFLLDLAHKVHRNTARWDEDVINWHNVNMSQGFGEAGTYYMQTKDPKHLFAAERNWQKMRQSYGQVPGGMFGGDENCRAGYIGPRQAVETCGMVEMMLSHETLLRISGDVIWADRCEDVTFNSLPASVTPDFKALRYLTAPNMVLSDKQNKSPGLQNGGPMLHMNPHDHRCCQHNMGHGWPYYVQNLWQATPGNGLAAVLYSPCMVTAKVGDGTAVIIREVTYYPFSERIGLILSMPKSVSFPLYLRVPGWCRNPQVLINNEPMNVSAKPQEYIMIDREWSDQDSIKLTLPMETSLRKWTTNKNSVSVDRGPLTYSLKIGEKYVREGGTEKWPAWEIHPTTPWNYGLVLNEANPAASFKVRQKEWPKSGYPFEAEAAPIQLVARAKKIPQWQLDHLGLVGEIQESPARSDEPIEEVTLIPMGAARLRISSFPVIGSGPDAHEWRPPPPPPAKMASHCNPSDTVEALWDGKIPSSSKDHNIRRFTWWDHRGSKEWVQYNLDGQKTVSQVEVYWFDDTGTGSCRIPASWRLLHKVGDDWKPVTGASTYSVEKDRFNKVAFDPVKTEALRVEVQLRPNVSGGILEMRVK